jgi:CheY-like chemotaxis protein
MPATVLLVEDEPAIRQLMARALTTEGYRVLEARNGREGAAVYRERGNEIDLLVTDVRMPYLSGTSLADELRQHRRTLKVLYITGFPDDQTANEHRLVKPFLRDTFLSTVQQILSVPVSR